MIKLRPTIVIAVLTFGIVSFSPNTGYSQTRLGLHVTQEELNIWKQRAASGPYKSTGDVSPNSPGDWSRIESQANTFVSSPSSGRWSGQTGTNQAGGTCWRAKDINPPLPGRSTGQTLRSAAFVYLVTGNTKYRDAVRNELLAQAATSGTNWANTSLWNASDQCAEGDAYSHEIMTWLVKLMFGYDYIRSSISSANQITIDNWFRNAGLMWERVVDNTEKKRFPKRNSDDYTTYNTGFDPYGDGGATPRLTHYRGGTYRGWMEGWNNRTASQVGMFGLAGILTSDSNLKSQAKRYFKEWLKYGVFPDGTDQDFKRWTSTMPSRGWQYVASQVGWMLALADGFARIGDTELFNYSTTEGKYGTAGGPKSLKQVIKIWLEHVNGTVVRYGTDQSANVGNSSYKIDSVDELAKIAYNRDTWIAPANVFYKDSFFKAIYMRTASGAPPYPSNPSTGGYDAWGGIVGAYPGVLFMFGQMEGKVWPYPSAAVSASPAAPSNVATSIMH
jgi:hypothetical protein